MARQRKLTEERKKLIKELLATYEPQDAGDIQSMLKVMGGNSGISFRNGTAFVKLLFLNNRDVTGSSVWYSNISFATDVAGKKEFKDVESRVTTAESSITQNANSITYKEVKTMWLIKLTLVQKV